MQNNLNNILLCGISEIAEIALVRSHDRILKITGVFDPESKKESFLGLPVIKNIEKISSYDAYIITALEDAQNLYSLIVDEIDSNLVFAYQYNTDIRNKFIEKLLEISPSHFDKVTLLNY